jgi:hypothetical protein
MEGQGKRMEGRGAAPGAAAAAAAFVVLIPPPGTSPTLPFPHLHTPPHPPPRPAPQLAPKYYAGLVQAPAKRTTHQWGFAGGSGGGRGRGGVAALADDRRAQQQEARQAEGHERKKWRAEQKVGAGGRAACRVAGSGGAAAQAWGSVRPARISLGFPTA